MPDRQKLESLLSRIDGRSYPAYRQLKGRWRIDDIEILVDHVQGDPYAAPSRIRLRIPTDLPSLDETERTAAEDWLLRRFAGGLSYRSRGSGKSGQLRVYRPGPEVIRRSSLYLSDDGVAEIRLCAGLPAQGRRILGRQAVALLTGDLPEAGRRLRKVKDDPALQNQRKSVAVQRELRSALAASGLVAFIADGSILPRATGISRSPLENAIPFQSPESLRVTLQTSSGPVTGMGIRRGVTVIVGGGFHGKSTLLQALQWGHLDHIPGDGRERVVSLPSTVKVRAEDGRRVERVDISNLLRDLPGGQSTAPFSTEDASGSTSQAAAIFEAIEAGGEVLLMDEDTSATNLLVRDERMQQLVPKDREPITPFVERVRGLYEEWGISTVMVIGGVGDYLGAADTVVLMDSWQARDATEEAHRLVPPPPSAGALSPLLGRPVQASGLQPTGKGRVRARDERRVDYGREEVDLMAVEQVLDGAHAATLGHAIRRLSEVMDRSETMPDLLDRLQGILDEEGLDALSPFREPVGELLWPRRIEVASTINRLRTTRVKP
jgi:predicted ABC-class ATPase